MNRPSYGSATYKSGTGKLVEVPEGIDPALWDEDVQSPEDNFAWDAGSIQLENSDFGQSSPHK